MTLDISSPPKDVQGEREAISAKLDAVIPAKSPDNLLVGTWNIRDFDRVTAKWHSETGDSPVRDLSNIVSIAEIVRRFDIAAIQETRRSAEAFLLVMKALGDDWSFVVTDVSGNRERLAFVYDRTRVRPSGLACELVVGEDPDADDAGLLQGQFARTPYAISFAAGASVATLVTLHVTWGESSGDRLPELREIAAWLARWATQGDPWGSNLIALGDFNIDRQGDPLYQAFTSTGLRPPDNLNFVPRTIFDDPFAPPGDHHFYDQIAWFGGDQGVPGLTLAYRNSGTFDFTELHPRTSRQNLSWRISDHFPLWVEFTAER